MASVTVFRRCIALAALALVALAMGLGRGGTRPELVDGRRPASPRYHLIRASVLRTLEHQLLDADIGCVETIRLPRDDAVSDAVASPWCDSRGRSQMVGPWKGNWGQAQRRVPQEFGLVRWTVPDGQVLERVLLDVVPFTRPCWFPGPAARILFATGDGRLHRLDFDDGPGSRAVRRDGPRRAWHLPWQATLPAPGVLVISDPTWPDDPRLGARLIAAITVPGSPGAPTTDAGPHLWWLRLDRDATAVEAAGRLTTPAPAGAPESPEEDRFPALATAPDGTLVVAYLSRPSIHFQWQLRLAPVAIDPASGEPRVDPATCRVVARQCASSAPVFSPDGHWLFVVVDRGDAPPQVVKCEVAAVLDRSSSSAVAMDE
jgi:hypothetical protein